MGTVSLPGDWLTSDGNRRRAFGTFTFSNSYTTGGESLTPAMVGLGIIDSLDINQGIGGLIFRWDKANQKVLAFYPTGGATASPGAIADPKVTSGASSATAVNATTPDITPGRAKEVAAATNLSAITFDFEACGR